MNWKLLALDLSLSLSAGRNTPFQHETDGQRCFKALRKPGLLERLPTGLRIFEIEFEYDFRFGSCVTSVARVAAARNCTRDEGGPFGFGRQGLIPSHRKLLWSKAMVVSVAETPGR